jgi:hypothetical protein
VSIVIEIFRETSDQLVLLLPTQGIWGPSLILLAIGGFCIVLGIVTFRRATAAWARWFVLLFVGIGLSAIFLFMWSILAGLSYSYSFDRKLGTLRYETFLFGFRMAIEEIALGQIEPAHFERCTAAVETALR